MNKTWLDILSFLMSFQVTPKKIDRILEAKGRREQQNTAFVAPEAVRVSAVQLSVRKYQNLKDYAGQMYDLAKEAAENGAQLVVFPEYVGLLAGTMLPNYEKIIEWVLDGENKVGLSGVKLAPEKVRLLAETFHHFLYETYMYTFSAIARLLRIYLVAGTCLFYEDGQLRNRCVVFGPDGEPAGAQEKVSAVGFDKALGVTPCDVIETIPTPMGDISVVIGSDNYYFECVKIARARGVKIIAAPDSREGVTRDLLRCRADEQNLYTVYSCLTGTREHTTALAGIFAPVGITPDRDGFVACAADTEPQTVTARVNLEKLEHVFTESGPNPEFLRGDYPHSYRYCGTPPLGETE